MVNKEKDLSKWTTEGLCSYAEFMNGPWSSALEPVIAEMIRRLRDIREAIK